jgi:hypothetical protein
MRKLHMTSFVKRLQNANEKFLVNPLLKTNDLI